MSQQQRRLDRLRRWITFFSAVAILAFAAAITAAISGYH